MKTYWIFNGSTFKEHYYGDSITDDVEALFFNKYGPGTRIVETVKQP